MSSSSPFFPPPAPAPAPAPSAVPERCLTFCQHGAEAQAMCRMFCLRKRAPLPTRAESLARLRSHSPPCPPSRSSSSSRQSSFPVTDSTSTPLSSISTASSSAWSWIRNFSPLAAARSALAPYSLVIVRGTLDGVIGRYMEELEGLDNEKDFGHLSRSATESERRRAGEDDPVIEWFDWGDHGSLLHVPLISIFSPVLNMPANLSRLFAPSANFIASYLNTFSDGSQKRALDMFVDHVRQNGAWTVLGKVREHHAKKAAELREARERALSGATSSKSSSSSVTTAGEKEADRDRMDKGRNTGGNKTSSTADSGSAVGGGSSSVKGKEQPVRHDRVRDTTKGAEDK